MTVRPRGQAQTDVPARLATRRRRLPDRPLPPPYPYERLTRTDAVFFFFLFELCYLCVIILLLLLFEYIF